MKDKRLLYLLGAGTLTGLAGTAGAQQQRPNIIYMMADQLRADVLGYAGDGLAVTPNIDRFARQSLDFTNAVSVSPVSAAYRASLITGKYTSSTGMVINELNLNPNHRTLAHVLTDAGYQTGYVGKVHWNDAQRILRYGRSRRRARACRSQRAIRSGGLHGTRARLHS